MGLRALKYESIGDLSPAVVASFNSFLAQAIFDCTDRPLDARARSVTLMVELVPSPEQSGAIDKVEAQAKVTSKSPSVQTGKVRLGLRGNKQLVFNPEALHDPDQATLLPDPEDR